MPMLLSVPVQEWEDSHVSPPGVAPSAAIPIFPHLSPKVAIRRYKVSKFQGTFPTRRYQTGGAAIRA